MFNLFGTFRLLCGLMSMAQRLRLRHVFRINRNVYTAHSSDKGECPKMFNLALRGQMDPSLKESGAPNTRSREDDFFINMLKKWSFQLWGELRP